MSGGHSIHATLVAHQGVGCLLLGFSGSGKSRLAAELMALGGKIIADDQVRIFTHSGMLMGGCLPNMNGVVELRGVGLYRVPDAATQHVIHLAIHLGETPERLPLRVSEAFEGISIPSLRLPSPPQTSALYVMTVMKAVHEGRILPADWRPGV